MAGPLVDLSRKLEQIEKGDFGVKIQSKRKDEVGLLAGAFDHMSERLARTTTSIDLLETEIERRKASEAEKEQLITDLRAALADVRTLSGLLPICSHCKKIRDDQGYWNRLEAYIQKHTDAEFSHSICQECAKKYYPDMILYKE